MLEKDLIIQLQQEHSMVAEPEVEYETNRNEKSILKQYLKIADDYTNLNSIVKMQKQNWIKMHLPNTKNKPKLILNNW